MIEVRRFGTNPLLETRAEAYDSVDKQKRYSQILEILSSNIEPMSAKEISVSMFNKGYVPTSERNFVSPRLTELSYEGVVECVGTKICNYTGKKVGVWEIRNNKEIR
ncbi:MAG: DNA gyrase [Bacilli bacterium]|nr:DNA gyrase [Bacilli bacterium]